MAYEQSINKHQDWGGDLSTGFEPVAGQRVQEFIKNTFENRVGVLHYDSDNRRYLGFSDRENLEKWLEDPEININLILIILSFPSLDPIIPEIGPNNNWFINGEDTGKPSQGNVSDSIFRTTLDPTTIQIGNVPIGTNLNGMTIENILSMMFYGETVISLLSIEITVPPDKTSYYVGDDFDPTGMVITANYTDGTSKVISNYVIVGGNNMQLGLLSVSIVYSEDDITRSVYQAITVEEVSVRYPVLTNPSINIDDFNISENLINLNRSTSDSTEVTLLLSSNRGSINPDYSLDPPTSSPRCGELQYINSVLSINGISSQYINNQEQGSSNLLTFSLKELSHISQFIIPINGNITIPCLAGKQPIDSEGNNYEQAYPEGYLMDEIPINTIAISAAYSNMDDIASTSLLNITLDNLEGSSNNYTGVVYEGIWPTELNGNKQMIIIPDTLELQGIMLYDDVFTKDWQYIRGSATESLTAFSRVELENFVQYTHQTDNVKSRRLRFICSII